MEGNLVAEAVRGRTAPALASFAEHGFAHLGPVLTPEEAVELGARLDAHLRHPGTAGRIDLDGVDATGAPGAMTVLFDWWSAQDDLTATVSSALAAAAGQLLDRPAVELISDETFVKPPQHGAVMQWHQDYAVYPDDARDFLTCWIALDSTSVDNGALEVAHGSHREGRFLPPEIARGITAPSRGMQPLIDAGTPELPDPRTTAHRRSHLLVPRGHASAHHCLLWHRSGANSTDHSRRGVALRFRITGG